MASGIDREQIIKALECCAQDDCDNCPNTFGNCYANLAGYALALIRELTEENKRFAHESECHRQTVIDNLQRSLEYLNEETERVKADTVRKMREETRQRCIIIGDEEYVTLCDIDQIAQEMLEEGQG